MNYDFFNSLQNTKVQDLYWLLFKTSPLKACPKEFSIPFFPKDIIDQWEEHASDYFRSLDNSPEELQHFVDRKKNYRLGFYAESLLSYFFQTFAEVELLIQNFQITEDKTTIGEIDFVIRWNNRILHIELAVKYYLLLPHSDPYTTRNWIGPSRKDNLQKKLTKIEGHQLPLGKHELLLNSIPGIKEELIESYFLFRGQFFWNEQVACDYLNHEPLHYFFNQQIKASQNNYSILYRPDWLGSIDRKEPYKKHETAEWDNSSKPKMVKLNSKKVCFIVPDDWNN